MTAQDGEAWERGELTAGAVALPAQARILSTAVVAQDATARAGEIWRRTLDEYEQPPLDDGIREELLEYVNRRRT